MYGGSALLRHMVFRFQFFVFKIDWFRIKSPTSIVGNEHEFFKYSTVQFFPINKIYKLSNRNAFHFGLTGNNNWQSPIEGSDSHVLCSIHRPKEDMVSFIGSYASEPREGKTQVLATTRTIWIWTTMCWDRQMVYLKFRRGPGAKKSIVEFFVSTS